MAFFDEIAGKAKKYAAVAAEKAKDVAELAADKAKDVKETAQTRLAIKAEERELEKNYCAIGQWFCAEYTGEMPDAVKDVVAAIEAGRAKIAELEQKYRETGRLVIRASGTEPRVRVMIEGPDQREMDRDVYALSKLIEQELK